MDLLTQACRWRVIVVSVCVCVCVFDGVNQPLADSELSYHNRILALRVHLNRDCRFATSIEFTLYALFYKLSKSVGLQLPPLHIIL